MRLDTALQELAQFLTQRDRDYGIIKPLDATTDGLEVRALRLGRFRPTQRMLGSRRGQLNCRFYMKVK